MRPTAGLRTAMKMKENSYRIQRMIERLHAPGFTGMSDAIRRWHAALSPPHLHLYDATACMRVSACGRTQLYLPLSLEALEPCPPYFPMSRRSSTRALAVSIRTRTAARHNGIEAMAARRRAVSSCRSRSPHASICARRLHRAMRRLARSMGASCAIGACAYVTEPARTGRRTIARNGCSAAPAVCRTPGIRRFSVPCRVRGWCASVARRRTSRE